MNLLVGLVGLVLGELSGNELIPIVGKPSVVAFLVGVVFSGVLAITADRRKFDRPSLRFVTALGAGGGLLYFLFIAAMNAARVWSASHPIANLTVRILLGGGSAAATLILARRAGHARKSGEESRTLQPQKRRVVGRPATVNASHVVGIQQGVSLTWSGPCSSFSAHA